MKHILFQQLVPCWGSLDERLHGRTAMELDVSGRHGFSTEQTQPIHMPKMGMCENEVINGRISNESELPSQISCRFDKNGFSSRGLDAQRNRASEILTSKIFATWTRAARLGAPSVLGDYKQCNDRHDDSTHSCNIDIFRGKTSSETPVWNEMTGLWHDQRRYPSLAKNSGCECVGQSMQTMLRRSGSVGNCDSSSTIQTTISQP